MKTHRNVCRIVFKTIYFQQRFQTYAFSMKTISVLVWTGGQNAYISMRFHMKTHQCGLSLRIDDGNVDDNLPKKTMLETTGNAIYGSNWNVSCRKAKFSQLFVSIYHISDEKKTKLFFSCRSRCLESVKVVVFTSQFRQGGSVTHIFTCSNVIL